MNLLTITALMTAALVVLKLAGLTTITYTVAFLPLIVWAVIAILLYSLAFYSAYRVMRPKSTNVKGSRR